MPKYLIELVKNLTIKEKPIKIDMPVDGFLKLALNTPIKNNKGKKNRYHE